jgi:hypothetical protein
MSETRNDGVMDVYILEFAWTDWEKPRVTDQFRWCHFRNLNRTSPEYKFRVLTLHCTTWCMGVENDIKLHIEGVGYDGATSI